MGRQAYLNRLALVGSTLFYMPLTMCLSSYVCNMDVLLV